MPIPDADVLFATARKGDMARMKTLLLMGERLTVRNPQGESLLHVCARQGHGELGKFLVHRGIDVNAADAQGVTPLMVAAQWGRHGLVTALLPVAHLDACDANGATAEDRAIANRHPKVTALIASGRTRRADGPKPARDKALA